MKLSALALSVAVLSLAASDHAAALVAATSVSTAQAGVSSLQSYADVLNGAPYFASYTGPSGTANFGPLGQGVTSAFANTTQPDGALLATSEAYADLATGTLRSAGQAPGGPGRGVGSAIANSRWTEVVTFNNTSGRTLELGITWSTDGTATPSSPIGTYWISVLSGLYLGNVNRPGVSAVSMLDDNPATGGLKDRQFNYGNLGGGAAVAFWTSTLSGNDLEHAWTTTLLGPSSGVMSATLLIPAGLSAIDIDARLNLDCRNGVLCDFSHTASFGFGALPAGLSWTSDSGVFLTAAVPEPATYGLMGAGLAVLALARRKALRSRLSAG